MGRGKRNREREREANRRRLAHGVAAVCLCWQTHLSWWEGKRLAKEGRTKPVGCGYQAAVIWFHGHSTNGKRGVSKEAVEFYRLWKTKEELLIDAHNQSSNFVFLMIEDPFVTVQQKHSHKMSHFSVFPGSTWPRSVCAIACCNKSLRNKLIIC